MSAFDRSFRVFPVSAVLLSGMLASMVGSDSDSASAQESPVTGSSFSSATSVHDDKHVRNAVLQHSASEARPLGEIQRGWTAAHGKAPSRSKDVVSLQSADARPSASVAKNRRPKAVALSKPSPMIMASAGRPLIPPVPEPVRENSPPEELDAVELAPVEPLPATDQSVADAEPSIPELPVLEPAASEATPPQQPSVVALPSVEKVPATSTVNTEQKVLSASQRLKLALEEERRRFLAEQTEANQETPELPSLDEGSIDLDPVEDLADDMSAEQLPSQSDLQAPSANAIDESENSLLDERARRFVRLKQQLMQLKSQLKQPDSIEEPERNPVATHDEHADPQPNHPASDPEPGHEGHSEELLPPVDGHDAPHSEHPETKNHASEHSSNDPSSHDVSANDHSPDVVIEHSEAPHGHDAVEHEPTADSHAAESSHGEDNHHADDSHGEAAAGDHSAASGAAHAASEHAVVHGTIDRLGLANNLYAVGEYELALDMYEKIDMTELTAQQQIWSDYQMANCLRRMGRNGDASNRYRRIAEQPEAGWLSEQSRWWVDVLEQIRQLQSSLEENPENPEENLQSPFQGVPRETKSSGGTAGPSESGSMKSRSTKSGHTDHPAGTNTKSDHKASSGKTSTGPAKPSKERITHFAPVEKEPKHGEH